MSDIQAIAASLSPPEQRAVALVGLMIRMHGGKDGEGLFEGQTRYAVLHGRLKLTAERSHDVRSWWDLMSSEMRWSLGSMRHDEAILDLTRPSETDADTLDVLAFKAPHVSMIARQLVRRERDADITAAREMRDYAAAPLEALAPDGDDGAEAAPKSVRRAAKADVATPDDEIPELL